MYMVKWVKCKRPNMSLVRMFHCIYTEAEDNIQSQSERQMKEKVVGGKSAREKERTSRCYQAKSSLFRLCFL